MVLKTSLLALIYCFLYYASTVHGSFLEERQDRILKRGCKTNSPLAGSMLVDFVGRPSLLTTTDVALVGEALIESYNSVVWCSNRTLSSFALATSLTRYALKPDDTEVNFALEFLLEGNCKNCRQGGRLLFDDQDSCACRGPTEGIYNLTLRERLDSLISNGRIAGIKSLSNLQEIIVQKDCPDTTELSLLSVVVEFAGCETSLTKSNIQELGALFQDTYNKLNALNTERCDPEFRQISDVAVSLDADFVVGASTQRTLMRQPFDETNRVLQEACSEPFGLRFEINATCRGCDATSATLFDRVDEGNQAISSKKKRSLQSAIACRCPASPLLRGITEREMLQAFQGALSERTVSFIQKVEDLIEVKPVACAGESGAYTTLLEIIWETPADAVSAQVEAALAEQCRISYNNLAKRFCDPFFRRMESVELMDQAQSPGNGRNLQQLFRRRFGLVYRIVFTCRGCPSRRNLFNDASRRRRLSAGDSKLERRIQEEDSGQKCYCAVVNAVDGAATEREFLAQYAADFKLIMPAGEISDVDELGLKEEEVLNQSECSKNRDCDPKETGDLCIANQCIFDGNPRITLTWNGDDDYDLYCTTPENVTISYENQFDASSSGVFDTGYVQTVSGNHVESIYFPIDGSSPGGEYLCRVVEFENRTLSAMWTIQVTAGKAGVILSQMGTGSRDGIKFRHEDAASPDVCDLEKSAFSCCQDTDCSDKNSMCSNFRCIQDGDPRFTLTWFGNDLLRLYVYTPEGGTISALNPADSVTGGMYEERPRKWVSTKPTFQAQNVYFPPDSVEGEYIFFVESVQQNGVADAWILTASHQGDEIYSGSGSSAYFSLVKEISESMEGPGCFSGQTTILTKDRGRIHMEDLRIGDLVADASNQFERVYSFGHYNKNQVSNYLRIEPFGAEVSKNHMVFVNGGRSLPASALKVGDTLLLGQKITSIRPVRRAGAFAPFTMSGTILVNGGVAASNYVAFQDSEVLLLMDDKLATPLSYHWLAHTFQSPHRLWCRLHSCRSETYTKSGISTWVHLPFKLTDWWLRQDTLLMTIILLPILAILGLITCGDLILHSGAFMGVITFVCLIVWIIRHKNTSFGVARK